MDEGPRHHGDAWRGDSDGATPIQLFVKRNRQMKRTILAVALAAFAAASYGSSEDMYRNNAGESEADNVVKQQIADANPYRNDAGQRDESSVQLGDNGYRNDAGERDENPVQLGESGFRNDAGEPDENPLQLGASGQHNDADEKDSSDLHLGAAGR
jgi:hypothetical protein